MSHFSNAARKAAARKALNKRLRDITQKIAAKKANAKIAYDRKLKAIKLTAAGMKAAARKKFNIQIARLSH